MILVFFRFTSAPFDEQVTFLLIFAQDGHVHPFVRYDEVQPEELVLLLGIHFVAPS